MNYSFYSSFFYDFSFELQAHEHEKLFIIFEMGLKIILLVAWNDGNNNTDSHTTKSWEELFNNLK